MTKKWCVPFGERKINGLHAGLLHDTFVTSSIKCALTADATLSLSRALNQLGALNKRGVTCLPLFFHAGYMRTFHSVALDI